MPRIKRWFPVSHDINNDPEIIELTELFDLPGLKIWLQILSIADKNDGEVSGELDYICKSFLYLFTSNSRRYGTRWRLNRCKMTLEWMQDKRWIEIKSGSISVTKHWKYHRMQEPNELPPDLTIPSPLHSYQNKNDKPAPSADSSSTKKSGNGLDPKVRLAGNKIYAIDPKRFARLAVWLNAASRTYPPAVIVAALEKFLPYANDSNIPWWPYLDKILDRTEGKTNARHAETESERFKRQDQELGKSLFAGTRLGPAGR